MRLVKPELHLQILDLLMVDPGQWLDGLAAPVLVFLVLLGQAG